MIELAFSESTAGSLRYAKTLKRGDYPGGSSRDVVALTLALDIGDLSDLDTNMNSRKRLQDDMFRNSPGVSDAMWKTNQHTLKRLEEAKEMLEPVRMWICANDPCELCGLYFVCHLMKDAQTPLSVVCVPSEFEKDDGIINYRSTGEVHPDTFGAFAAFEEPVSQLKRMVYSNIWERLVLENAALRVVINGSLIGVPEDFYDFGLRANMPGGELKIVQIIGKTLTQIPGVGDQWLFSRIQTMLQSGELIMLSAASGDNPYSAIVKRNR